MSYVIVAKYGKKYRTQGVVGTKREAQHIVRRGASLNRGKGIKFVARKI